MMQDHHIADCGLKRQKKNKGPNDCGSSHCGFWIGAWKVEIRNWKFSIRKLKLVS
jgi:hypothetical protein